MDEMQNCSINKNYTINMCECQNSDDDADNEDTAAGNEDDDSSNNNKTKKTAQGLE